MASRYSLPTLGCTSPQQFTSLNHDWTSSFFSYPLIILFFSHFSSFSPFPRQLCSDFSATSITLLSSTSPLLSSLLTVLPHPSGLPASYEQAGLNQNRVITPPGSFHIWAKQPPSTASSNWSRERVRTGARGLKETPRTLSIRSSENQAISRSLETPLPLEHARFPERCKSSPFPLFVG